MQRRRSRIVAPAHARSGHARGRERLVACEPLEGRRLLSAGDLDPTFGAGGIAPAPTDLSISDTAVQSDGKVVVVGDREGRHFVERLNADGSPDTSFGSGGTVELLALPGGPSTWQAINAVAAAADGTITVAGRGFDPTFTQNFFLVARLLPNGSPDPSFGGGGQVRTDLGPDVQLRYANAAAVALQADGKPVVAGTVNVNRASNNLDVAVVRYNTDGSLDGSFGSGGVRMLDFEGADSASDVAIDYNGTSQSNPYWGTIAVVGEKQSQTSVNPFDFAVGRLTPAGNPDTSFDGNGVLITRFPGGDSTAQAVVIQPGGKIVAAGTKGPFGTDLPHNFALARYLPNGALDPSFGPNGTGLFETDFDGGNDFAFGAAPSYQGGIVVAGVSDGVFAAAAYTPDGRLDTRFGGDGMVKADWLGGRGASAIVAAAGRRLVVAGGNRVARLIDIGSVVSIGSFDPNAAEPGTNVASFIVARTERLPYAERVYIGVGGTAAKPGNPRLRRPDYTGDGITFPFENDRAPAYVDIPANQTFTVVTITPTDDANVEGDETAVFTIARNDAYDIGTPPAATLIIHDDEPPPTPLIVGRRAFYDGSAFDAAPGETADDAAIAPDKQALLPGQTPSAANVTAYAKGINGVIVDISNLPNGGAAVTAADFAFQAGTGGDPAAWPALGAAPTVVVRPNAGLNGSDRVVLTWPADGARNQWLRVTVLADAATGLAASDVFYFGNLIGDTGDGATTFRVNALDLAAVRRVLNTNAAVSSATDFNRDGRVNSLDMSLVKQNLGRTLPPPAAPAAAPAPAFSFPLGIAAGGASLVEGSVSRRLWTFSIFN